MTTAAASSQASPEGRDLPFSTPQHILNPSSSFFFSSCYCLLVPACLCSCPNPSSFCYRLLSPRLLMLLSWTSVFPALRTSCWSSPPTLLALPTCLPTSSLPPTQSVSPWSCNTLLFFTTLMPFPSLRCFSSSSSYSSSLCYTFLFIFMHFNIHFFFPLCLLSFFFILYRVRFEVLLYAGRCRALLIRRGMWPWPQSVGYRDGCGR